MSVSDTRAIAAVLRQFNSSVQILSFKGTSMDDTAMPIIISGLQHCTRLTHLHLPAISCTSDDGVNIVQVIDQNATTLQDLDVPVGDDTLPKASSAIIKCPRLVRLRIGSPTLTNASAPTVAEVIRSQPSLTEFGLAGEIDDDGFSSIAPSLQALAARLELLILNWTRLSVSMLSDTLPSLTSLTDLQLMGSHINDDDFGQLTTTFQQMKSLQTLILINAGVTCRSVADMEKLLHDAPTLLFIFVVSKKDSFFPDDGNVDHIAQRTTMEVLMNGSLEEPLIVYDNQINEGLLLCNSRSQELLLSFCA